MCATTADVQVSVTGKSVRSPSSISVSRAPFRCAFGNALRYLLMMRYFCALLSRTPVRNKK